MGISGEIAARVVTGTHGRDALVGQIARVITHGDEAAKALIPTSGNSFKLLSGTSKFLDDLIPDIAGASEHVNLSMYGFKPGGRADLVVDALKAKALEGVPITVQIDQVGSGLLRNPFRRAPSPTAGMIDAMRGAGIDVQINKVSFRRGPHNLARLALDHRKIIEIDGRISYQGGINFVDDWMNWDDVMLRAEGPVSAQAGAMLAGRWRDLGGTVTEQRAAVLARGLTGGAVHDAGAGVAALGGGAEGKTALQGIAQQVGNGSRSQREITDLFLHQADTATKRLWVTNPYFGDNRIVSALERASQRGVDVRVTVPPPTGGGQAQDVITIPFTKAYARRMVTNGVNVRQVHEFAHTKAWIADDVANVGSFNFDRSSTVRNFESIVASSDPSLVHSLEDVFATQQATSRALTVENTSAWRGWQWLRDKTGLQF